MRARRAACARLPGVPCRSVTLVRVDGGALHGGAQGYTVSVASGVPVCLPTRGRHGGQILAQRGSETVLPGRRGCDAVTAKCHCCIVAGQVASSQDLASLRGVLVS